MTWKRIGGWVSRGFLVLSILAVVQSWLDVLVFQTEEYERLIGSEAACGKFQAYCSWNEYILDGMPFAAFAVAALVALVWRTLPGREQVLAGLCGAIVVYLAWRFFRTMVLSE